MGIFSFLVKWCESVTGNFGWGIVLSMLIFAVVCSPLYFMQRAHRKKKKELLPSITAIRKKYNVGKLGPNVDDDDSLSDEIKAMTLDQRSEAMSNELGKLYKENHYHAFTGWIPTVLQYVLVILMYMSITAAVPEGSDYARNAWSLVQSGAVEWGSITMKMLVIFPVVGLLTTVAELLLGKAKKASAAIEAPSETVKKKGVLIGTVLAIVLPVGLDIFFGFRLITASVIAFTSLIVGRFAIVAIAAAVKAIKARKKLDFT